jgi:hypothetical protein
MVRVGLLLRVGEKNIGDGLPKEHIDRLTILSKEYPYFFSSKTILELLSSRHLILVSESSALPAFQAVMIGFLEEERKGI